jgi:hypothetical protein
VLDKEEMCFVQYYIFVSKINKAPDIRRFILSSVLLSYFFKACQQTPIQASILNLRCSKPLLPCNQRNHE